MSENSQTSNSHRDFGCNPTLATFSMLIFLLELANAARRMLIKPVLPSLRHYATPKKPMKNPSQDVFNDVFITNTLRSNKAENEYIKCTIYNDRGDMVTHGKNMRKPDFMRKYNILPRDLRKVVRSHTDSLNSVNGVHVEFVPLLVTRKDFILLNFLNIRALIRHDSLVVFEASSSSASSSKYAASHSHSMFLKELSKRLKSNHPDANRLPYEFRALESILINVTSNLDTEMKVHKTVLNNILISLEHSIERTKLRYLLIESKKLAQFHQKAKLVGDLLNDMLEQDDELNALYLSEQLQGNVRTSFDHQEIELLLESYCATIDEIVQTVEALVSQIKTSEELIKFVLDANRNDLMLLGLRFSIGLLSLGLALYVAALYGMNLENFIEEIDGGFEAVVITGTISLVVLFIYSRKQLSKVQRITMCELPRRSAHASRAKFQVSS